MAKDIDARRKGGPNLQAKYLEWAEQLPKEIVVECKEKVVEVWAKVEEELARRRREEVAAKAAADFGELRRRMRRRFAEEPKHEGASSFLPAKQPTAEDAEQSPQEVVAPTLVPVSPREPILLNPGAPYDNAQKLITEYHWHTGQRVRTLQHYQKDFWKWDGTHWVQVDDDAARSDVWKQLDAADKILKGGKRTLRTKPASCQWDDGCATWRKQFAQINFDAGMVWSCAS